MDFSLATRTPFRRPCTGMSYTRTFPRSDGGKPGDVGHYLGTLSGEAASGHPGSGTQTGFGGVCHQRGEHLFSRIQFPKIMSGYATLAGLDQMPIRFDAHYEVHRMPTDPQQTRQMYRRTGVLQGIGNDYLWIDGVASERWDSFYPESCTGPDTQAPAHIKARETCPKPGDLHWDTLENAMKPVGGWQACTSAAARALGPFSRCGPSPGGQRLEHGRRPAAADDGRTLWFDRKKSGDHPEIERLRDHLELWPRYR